MRAVADADADIEVAVGIGGARADRIVVLVVDCDGAVGLGRARHVRRSRGVVDAADRGLSGRLGVDGDREAARSRAGAVAVAGGRREAVRAVAEPRPGRDLEAAIGVRRARPDRVVGLVVQRDAGISVGTARQGDLAVVRGLVAADPGVVDQAADRGRARGMADGRSRWRNI